MEDLCMGFQGLQFLIFLPHSAFYRQTFLLSFFFNFSIFYHRSSCAGCASYCLATSDIFFCSVCSSLRNFLLLIFAARKIFPGEKKGIFLIADAACADAEIEGNFFLCCVMRNGSNE